MSLKIKQAIAQNLRVQAGQLPFLQEHTFIAVAGIRPITFHPTYRFAFKRISKLPEAQELRCPRRT